MKVGIIGLEGAGKKSLFSLLTGKDITASFTNKEEIGVIDVPDERIDFLTALSQSKKTVYSKIEFYLIPSIQADSEETKKALLQSKTCDMFCIVIRSFTDETVYHPMKSVDPVRDYNTIFQELILADLLLVETRLDRIEAQLKSEKPAHIIKEKEILIKAKELLDNGSFLNKLELSSEDEKAIKSLEFITLKPVFGLINCDEDKLNSDFNLPKDVKTINISVKIEREIQDLSGEEKKEFLSSLGLTEPSLERFIKFAYSFGDLISFLTTGPKETHSWTIKRGETAKSSAGKIHSDLEKGFIRAEIVSFEDLKASGSEAKAKEQGLSRLEGKDYIVKDGDVVIFRFNV